MSLWSCPAHGVTGPMACCARAARVVAIEPSAGIRRVKCSLEFIAELKGGSVPVTVRIEEEPDGDLRLIATRHECAPATPAGAHHA